MQLDTVYTLIFLVLFICAPLNSEYTGRCSKLPYQLKNKDFLTSKNKGHCLRSGETSRPPSRWLTAWDQYSVVWGECAPLLSGPRRRNIHASDMKGRNFDVLIGRTYSDHEKAVRSSWWQEKMQGTLTNCIPGVYDITNKATMIRNFRLWFKFHGCTLEEARIVPQQWLLMDSDDCKHFEEHVILRPELWSGIQWVVKPTHSSEGAGITFHNNLNWFKGCAGEPNRIAQVAIQPLLIHNSKFDMRMYMGIVSTSPVVLYWHPGYVRRSLFPYSDTQELGLEQSGIHLTNVHAQMKFKGYRAEQAVWSLNQLAMYLESNGVDTAEHFWEKVNVIMRKATQIVYQSASTMITKMEGAFQLMGIDLMMDYEGNFKIIEINHKPSINANNMWQGKFHSQMLPSFVKLVVDIQTGLYPLHDKVPFQKYIYRPEKGSSAPSNNEYNNNEFGDWELAWHQYWDTQYIDPEAHPTTYPCPCNKNESANCSQKPVMKLC